MTEQLLLDAATFQPPPAATVVTGAAGWLGRAVVAAIGASGERQLRCLVRSTDQAGDVRAAAPDAEIVVGDVRDPVAVDRLFDGLRRPTVIHTAAVIHPAGRTREFWDVNVGGTGLVLDRARRAGAQRVVHVSSNSPFGFNATPDARFDDDPPYAPVGGYGESKMEAERLVRRAVARGVLDAVIVRAPWFYGPRQPDRQTRFFRSVRRGAFPIVGDGSNRRSMVYVDNLVQGVLRAERRRDVAGSAFWIADAEPYRMVDIIDGVRGALRGNGLTVSSRQLRVPAAAAGFADVADRLLQRAGRYVGAVHVLSELNKTIACSIDGARRTLGYEPTVDLDEGMHRSVQWCLAEGIAL